MSLFDQYETNAKKEAEGVDVPFPDAANKDGSIPTFTIAATSKANQKYSKALEQATRPFRRNMDAMKPEAADALYKEVFVKTVLKGWKNVQERDGSEIPYSPAVALELFERLPRVYDKLVAEAGGIELFRETQLEAEAGN